MFLAPSLGQHFLSFFDFLCISRPASFVQSTESHGRQSVSQSVLVDVSQSTDGLRIKPGFAGKHAGANAVCTLNSFLAFLSRYLVLAVLDDEERGGTGWGFDFHKRFASLVAVQAT